MPLKRAGQSIPEARRLAEGETNDKLECTQPCYHASARITNTVAMRPGCPPFGSDPTFRRLGTQFPARVSASLQQAGIEFPNEWTAYRSE
jgi:hypothetical protein